MRAFTGGKVVKNAGDTRDVGLIPGREMATHSPVFLPEKFYGQRSFTDGGCPSPSGSIYENDVKWKIHK